MLALNKGKPEQMNLKEILCSFLDFREEVITKRTLFDLNKVSIGYFGCPKIKLQLIKINIQYIFKITNYRFKLM